MSDSIQFRSLAAGVWRAYHGQLAAKIDVTDDGKFHAQVYRDEWILCDVYWLTFDDAKRWCLTFFREQSK
jgi:hypothetical protein